MTLDELIKEKEDMFNEAIAHRDRFPTEDIYKQVITRETAILQCLKETKSELERLRSAANTNK